MTGSKVVEWCQRVGGLQKVAHGSVCVCVSVSPECLNDQLGLDTGQRDGISIAVSG